MATVTTRPNIRIEIQNNLVEPMEVDDGEAQQETEFEDGEITEDPRTQPVPESNTSRIWNNKEGGFSTGADIFNDKEQEKLQDRANRFGLTPEEISNFTNEDLQRLHNSLGISGNIEKDVRFEAVHMRGTEEMSTEDVFEYFAKYLPSSVEWIDDESCNIVWQDKLSAARALHFTSNAVRGMPVDGPCDPFSKNGSEPEGECRSILLSNETRSIEIAKEPGDNDVNDNEVSISDISVPIPPGYWRRGLDHPKSKVLLLRFAFKTDRKPSKAERFSEYYKKYGNPNFGFLKGVISASCRNKFKGIFDRNKDIKKANGNSKNPWGDLAENWNEDERFSEQAYIDETLPPPTVEPDSTKKSGAAKAEVLKRLGTKRPHIEEADLENNQGSKKISKVPRMRMYADEEEVKIKRKKQLLQLKQQQSDVNDLRNMIGSNKSKMDKTEVHSDNDLGSRLKNRKQKEEENRRKLAVSRPVRDSYTDKKVRHKSPAEHERRSRHRDSVSRRSHYRNKMHSDRYERHRRHRSQSNEDLEHHKPKSKVAVVIKTQKRPTVASTVWSRITPKKERLKTASERLQSRRDSSSSSESSSADSSSSSSDSDSSDSSSESDEESNDEEEENKSPETSTKAATHRPGFTNPSALVSDRKSPLRIEINNDHFKEE
ncbi:hypothetical protein PPYR_11531 [Photinus pyralis]|uniref:Nuclear cap-binding protein subunit 3 n=2 Tax=Photinus pyralis TaxID=7054 RepID=A0A5N4ABK0_PHOPY|nr:nuclear cap-binding protein subunit 3-like [Photinus pyralis]KAB0794692.1 hypothetical protein PPYR_11531 [Photinus pyralis]